MKVTTVRLPDELAEKVEQAAEESERSQSDYIRFALRSHIEGGSNTEGLERRVAELEERVESLETSRERAQTGENRSRTRSDTRDPHGSRREDTAPVSVRGGGEAGSLDDDLQALDLGGQADTPEGREALRAMYEYVREKGRARKAGFVEDVYPDHQLGYSESSWWKALGREAEGNEGFVTLARRRDDLRPPAGRGSQWFEWAGED